MATFKTITSDDIKTTTSILNQLVDFVEEDVSGSNTRKKFQVFVTSSATNAVTSSLFQTVYDQNFTLQTANELFDMTMGIYFNSDTVTGSHASPSQDANQKLLFKETSLMMREKINIYRQHAQLLLGNATSRFTSPNSNIPASDNNNINEALFINFKRLFVRDGIKRETFAMKMFASSSRGIAGDAHASNITVTRINPATGSVILTDVGASTSIERSETGGDVGNIVLASNTATSVGLMYYQQGIAVLDMKKVFDGNQVMSGTISRVGSSATADVSGSFIPGFVISP